MVLIELFAEASAAFALYGAYKVVTEYADKGGFSLRKFLGIKRKPPSAKIRAALREQWLALAPGESRKSQALNGKVKYIMKRQNDRFHCEKCGRICKMVPFLPTGITCGFCEHCGYWTWVDDT